MRLTDKELIDLYFKRFELGRLGFTIFIIEVLLLCLLFRVSKFGFGFVVTLTLFFFLMTMHTGKVNKKIKEEMIKRGLL